MLHVRPPAQEVYITADTSARMRRSTSAASPQNSAHSRNTDAAFLGAASSSTNNAAGTGSKKSAAAPAPPDRPLLPARSRALNRRVCVDASDPDAPWPANRSV